MAKKHANKKPKIKPDKFAPPILKVVERMFDNLLINMRSMEKAIRSLDGALSSYIDFNGNGAEWRKWVEKKLDNIAKEKEKKSDNKS